MSALGASRTSTIMMGVAAGQAMEPTISGDAYTKMIENYMDDKAHGD